jgi:hypothetical protein
LRFSGMQIGSAGRSKTRTFWDINLILAMPFSRWGAKPYIVHPFLFPVDVATESMVAPSVEDIKKPEHLHPYQLALKWRQQLATNPTLKQSNIAAKEGISRARVTQVMHLLELPAAIQQELQSIAAPLTIHAFSERRLRSLLEEDGQQAQLHRWREMVQQYENSGNQ